MVLITSNYGFLLIEISLRNDIISGVKVDLFNMIYANGIQMKIQKRDLKYEKRKSICKQNLYKMYYAFPIYCLRK